MEYASKGIAGAGLGLGIAGTALGLLNGGLGLLGGMGGMTGMGGCCPQNMAVNRYEMTLVQENSAKDAKIALLEADKYVDQKLTDVYKDLNSQISNLQSQISQQAVYNATVNGTLNCMQQQIAQLQSLTKLVVPNSSVCPGWGNVTITPAAATTTTTSPAA